MFRPGPIFTGLLLADEINRTPPKTQAALLEAMQERQVTVEGTTFPLAAPFHVLATANPVEYEGTYPLPEAQLDRFLLRVPFGYPTPDEEWTVLTRRIGRRQEEQTLAPVIDADGLLRLQRACEDVDVDDVDRPLLRRALDGDAPPPPGARSAHRRAARSPCCSTARAYAVIDGRDFVVPEDVKAVAEAALAHRITVRPGAVAARRRRRVGRARRPDVHARAADGATCRAVTTRCGVPADDDPLGADPRPPAGPRHRRR